MSRATMSVRRPGTSPYLETTIRLAWMIGRLHRCGFTRQEYEARYPVALRTFRRDVDTLRLAGLNVIYAHNDDRYLFGAEDGSR